MCHMCDMEERTELSQRILHSLKTTRSILCDRLQTMREENISPQEPYVDAIKVVEHEILEAYKTFDITPYDEGDVIYA